MGDDRFEADTSEENVELFSALLGGALVPFRKGGLGEPGEFQRLDEGIEAFIGEIGRGDKDADGAPGCTYPVHLGHHLFRVGNDVDNRRRNNGVECIVVVGKQRGVTDAEVQVRVTNIYRCFEKSKSKSRLQSSNPKGNLMSS